MNSTTIIQSMNVLPTSQYFFQKGNAIKESHAIHLASKILSSYFTYSKNSAAIADIIGMVTKTGNKFPVTTTKSVIPAILTSPFQFSSQSTKVTISFYYYIAINSSSFPYPMRDTRWGQDGRKGSKNTPVLTKQQLEQLSRLSSLLSILFGKEVNLSMTQLHYPYLQSTILAKYLCHNAVSSTFLHFQESILSYPSLHITTLPSSITGIKIQLAGRIVTEPVVPRLTVKSAFVGTFSSYEPESQNTIDYGSYTTKNNLGSFTIKVWIASQ